MRFFAIATLALVVLAFSGCSDDGGADGRGDAGDTALADATDTTDASAPDAATDTAVDGATVDADDVGDSDTDDAGSHTDAQPADAADTNASDAASTADGGCASDHPHVGWTAELTENFHGVGGTAEIVDNCTVRITNFTFDGSGLDVRIYGASGGNYADGFVMSGDLKRDTPYDAETITATLPAGHSLDELDGVSVWCVDAAVDFGSGTFSAP